MSSRTNLPFVSSPIPPDLRQFLERVRESLSDDTYVRRTDYLGGTVPRYPTDPPAPPDPPGPPGPPIPPCGNPVTPTAPTGFEVAAGFNGFLLTWDMPGYCGHDRTEVYGLRRDGTAEELTVANMLGDSKGVMYSHVVQAANDFWCFWIKHVNLNDEEGPFCAAHLCARTAVDPGPIIESLKGRITESELYRNLGERIKLIDVTEPLSTLTQTAGITGRVFYSTTAPTNVTVDPDLTAGDLWVDTDDYVGTPPNGYYKTYRWTGSAWELLEDGPNQLSYAFYNEQLVRYDGDSLEASKREGLFAGAFAGIGNAYKYFIQGPLGNAPTGTQVGDIWAYKDPENDADAIFKRFNGNNWVNTPPTEDDPTNTNVDSNRRAAKFWGKLDAPPTGDPLTNPLVIGDQYLHGLRYLTGTTPDPKYTKIYVYNGIGAPGGPWVETTAATAFASALVWKEETVRVDGDNALAESIDLVYARVGDSRPNLCPNAEFELRDEGETLGPIGTDDDGVIGNYANFTVVTGNYGRMARKIGAFTESGALIRMPLFSVVVGKTYSVTGLARVTGGANNSARFGLTFYNANGDYISDHVPAYTTGTIDYDATYTVGPATVDQRTKLTYSAVAPSGATAARVLFQWIANGATQVGFGRVQAALGDPPMPNFSNESTSAMVGDVARARVGYCGKLVSTNPNTYETTDYRTKDECAAATTATGVTHTWFVGMPWAQAVKQVVVEAKPYCLKDGEVWLTEPPKTQATCVAGGGTWEIPGSVGIQQTFEALQKATGELYAQYSVKIDQNGFVAGFGLSSETVNGVPYSRFLVRADQFAIAAPATPTTSKTISSLTRSGTTATCVVSTPHGLVAGDDVSIYGTASTLWNQVFTVATVTNTTTFTFQVTTSPPTPATLAPGKTAMTAQKVAIPFIVTTTPVCLVGGTDQTVAYPSEAACTALDANGDPIGLWVPSGVYIDDAYINRATISWAQIEEATITYAKITTAVINDLTVNGLTVGECIKSANFATGSTGWQICGGGTAEFGQAVIRGQISGGAATALASGAGYFMGSVGNFRVGDPVGANMLWTQATGTLDIKGSLRGGAATSATVGTGYYLGTDGVFRVGVPGGKSLSWDGSGLILQGTAKSATWNGTLDANGVILTGASPDNTGWIIDNAGNAEFTTVHLRKGSVSGFTKGTQVNDSGPDDGDGVPNITAQLAAYVDVTHPVNGTGVIIKGAVDLKAKIAYNYGAAVYVTRRSPSAINPLNDGHTGRVLVYEVAPTNALMAANGLSNLAVGDYWYRVSNGLFSRYTGSAWVTMIMSILDSLGVSLPYVGSAINAWTKPGQEAAALYFARPSGFVVDSTDNVTFNSGRTVRYSYYVYNNMSAGGKIFWGSGQILSVLMNR